jgi:hypothetical protein
LCYVVARGSLLLGSGVALASFAGDCRQHLGFILHKQFRVMELGKLVLRQNATTARPESMRSIDAFVHNIGVNDLSRYGYRLPVHAV